MGYKRYNKIYIEPNYTRNLSDQKYPQEHKYKYKYSAFNPVQDDLFWAVHGWGAGVKRCPLSKICGTYPALMKLGGYTLPKEDPENT